MNWPLAIALVLILLKQFFKLYINHKPDLIDHLKAAVSLPLDASFLVVSLLVRKASVDANVSEVLCFTVVYLLISGVVSILWRVSDSAIGAKKWNVLMLAFPTNAVLSSLTFYFALNILK